MATVGLRTDVFHRRASAAPPQKTSLNNLQLTDRRPTQCVHCVGQKVFSDVRLLDGILRRAHCAFVCCPVRVWLVISADALLINRWRIRHLVIALNMIPCNRHLHLSSVFTTNKTSRAESHNVKLPCRHKMSYNKLPKWLPLPPLTFKVMQHIHTLTIEWVLQSWVMVWRKGICAKLIYCASLPLIPELFMV